MTLNSRIAELQRKHMSLSQAVDDRAEISSFRSVSCR